MWGYFIRFSDTIEKDIERNTSILTTTEQGYKTGGEIVEGLCAFGEYDDIEYCHKKAQILQSIIHFEVENYSILYGRRSLGKSGSLGCVVLDAKLISTHKI
jgi:hypothetical protein